MRLEHLGDFGEPFGYGIVAAGLADLQGDLDACLRVCLYDRYAKNARFTLAEKTSLGYRVVAGLARAQ